MNDDVLTQDQIRQLGALLPDDLDALRDAVRASAPNAWGLFHATTAGIAVIVAVVAGRLTGWVAYPATSAASADTLGRCLLVGLGLGAGEVVAAAADVAQAVLARQTRQ